MAKLTDDLGIFASSKKLQLKDDLGIFKDPQLEEKSQLEKSYKDTIQAKADQEAAQVQAEQEAKAKAADPKNWSVDQTKQYFKDNPPQNVQEAAQADATIKLKQEQQKELEKQLTGEDKEKEERAPNHPILDLNIPGQQAVKTMTSLLGKLPLMGFSSEQIVEGTKAYGDLYRRPLAGLTALAVDTPFAEDPSIKKVLKSFGYGALNPEKYPPERMTEALIDAGMDPYSAASLATLGQLGYYLGVGRAIAGVIQKGKLGLLNKTIKNVNDALDAAVKDGRINMPKVKIPIRSPEEVVRDTEISEIIDVYLKSRGLKYNPAQKLLTFQEAFKPGTAPQIPGFTPSAPVPVTPTVPAPKAEEASELKDVFSDMKFQLEGAQLGGRGIGEGKQIFPDWWQSGMKRKELYPVLDKLIGINKEPITPKEESIAEYLEDIARDMKEWETVTSMAATEVIPPSVEPKKPKLKPIITEKQQQAREKRVEIRKKQLEVEEAKEAKKAVVELVRQRRFNINLKNFETNAFIHDINKNLTPQQEEVIPFIIEETEVPKKLGRTDLEQIHKEQKENLNPIAQQVKKHFKESWDYIVENTDKVSVSEIENYVTHLWDIPKDKKPEITNWFSTRNRFMKSRFIETYYEGIEKFGLKPKTLKISDIIRIHDGVMNRTIENIKFVKSIKALEKDGVKLFARMDLAPPNWVFMDHPALREGLMIPGEAIAGEKISPELQDILTEMGVAIGRRINPRVFGKISGIEGLYQPGAPPEIKLKRFFESGTIAHEIGHHLDRTLKLGNHFVNQYKDELLALNAERIKRLAGQTVRGVPGEQYARSNEEQIAELFKHIFIDLKQAKKLAPTATADVLERLSKDGVLSKLVDFDFETKAKNLIEEKLNTLVKLPVKVHPDIAEALKVVFDSRFTHPAIHAYEKINGLLKKAWLSISFFHHIALGETGVATMGLKKVLGIYFNPRRIYRAVAKDELDVYKDVELSKKWIKRGVQLGASVDIPVQKIQRDLNNFAEKTKDKFFIGKMAKMVATFNERWDKALWDYIHDTLKLYGAESLAASNVDYTKSEVEIIKQEEDVAQFVNDVFGGQNWEALMVSPKTTQILSWSLLSPDWFVSTLRQAFSPTGVGAIHGENVKLRKRLGIKFWIKAAIYFGIGTNLVNMMYRKNDRNKYPDLYPEKMGLKDYAMTGNAIGHKTHLFVGRNKDGTERYVRWGKQFRELFEMLFDDTGFSPITASVKKVGGKASPLLQTVSTMATGHSLGGFKTRSIADARGWDRVWGIAKNLFKTPIPFSMRSIADRNKDFRLTDLAMPSSRGLTRGKVIDLYKTAIIHKNKQLFQEIYWDALQNNIPPVETFESAMSIVKAENTKEINSNLRNLEDTKEALKGVTDPKTRSILNRKKARYEANARELKQGKQLLERYIPIFEQEAKRIAE